MCVVSFQRHPSRDAPTHSLSSYLESDSRDDLLIKPWFWIVLLFVGSLFKSISDAWFVYKAVRYFSLHLSLTHSTSDSRFPPILRPALMFACKRSSQSLCLSTRCASA